MAEAALLRTVRDLEIQVLRLKAQVRSLYPSERTGTFADLEGLLADAGSFSEEEIEAAHYRFEWEGEEVR